MNPIIIGTPKGKARKAIAAACRTAGFGRGYAKEVRSTVGDPWSGHLLTLSEFAHAIRHDADPDPEVDAPYGTTPMPTGEWTVYIYAVDPRWDTRELIDFVRIEIARMEWTP